MTHTHRALSACPVCGDKLVTSRLGCTGCGTELVGQFEPCPFCALDDADLDLLRVFLSSRGNLKELEKHLEVSYPTARARFDAVLDKLGWKAAPDAEPADDGAAPAASEEGAVSGGEGAGQPSEAAPEPDEAKDGETPAPEGRGGDEIRDQVLAQVAAGVLTPDVAADLLGRLH